MSKKRTVWVVLGSNYDRNILVDIFENEVDARRLAMEQYCEVEEREVK